MRSLEYKQIRDDFVKSAKESKTPILGQFELTARCNLDCKMCYVHNQCNADLLPKELTTEQWKRIFNEAYECEMLYATLSGGECMLRRDFKELYLHLWNKNIFVTVMTNGTLIDADYVEFFRLYPPDMIQVSLYGSSEDAYIHLTGHKGFEKAVSAITSLEAAGIDVRVAISPSKYMIDDYLNILRLCKEKKFVTVNNDILVIPNRDDPDKNDYYFTEDEIIRLSVDRTQLYRPVIPCESTPEPCGSNNSISPVGITCNAGNCLATITWEGKMYLCVNAMLGGFSLLDMSYAEAWEKTKQVASEVVLAAECVGCPYETICAKCPAFRLNDWTSGHCNRSLCNITRRLVAAGVKKLDIS